MKNLFILNFSLGILFLTEIYFVCSNNVTGREKYKVVIVGAGISGLSAAVHLQKNNFTDFLILEASNRLGGRVYTAPFGDFLIEYGAQWVHGQGGNIVYKIAEPYEVLYVQTFDEGEHLVKSSESKINLTLASDMFSEVSHYFGDATGMAACNCSKEEFFDRKYENFTALKNSDLFTKEAIKDLMMKYEGIHDGTDKLNNEGSWGSTQFWTTNGSFIVAWKSGYRTFIDIILGKYDQSELPILNKTKFNKVVQTIDWSGSEVQLTCEDGSQYYADHVITTVSLGVLKHSAKTMFTPPLPERKLSAIQSLGIDLVNKIFIQFETRWWPLTYEYGFYLLWSNEDKQKFKKVSRFGGWATEITGFHFVENQPRVLLGWLVGDAAHNLEKLSDKEVTDAVMELLHWFFNGKFAISPPLNVTRSAWFSNRFVRGSYSFRTLDSDRLGYSAADIAQPIAHNHSTPVVLFAGEATHDHYFSTVHGAFETGLREADRILSF